MKKKSFLSGIGAKLALAAGESGYDTCLGSGNVTCSTGDKVEYVLIPFGLD